VSLEQKRERQMRPSPPAAAASGAGRN